MSELVPGCVTWTSVPLTKRDLDGIARLRSDDDALSCLARLAQLHDLGNGDAALIHAAIRAGLHAVEEQIAEAGYAELAADKEYLAEQRKIARRRESTERLESRRRGVMDCPDG